MPNPITIHKPKLLLVEGTHEEKFFQGLLREDNIYDVQVMPIIGKSQFREKIEILTKLDNFSDVQSIGLVRDADESFTNAFNSLTDALANANLAVPNAPMTFTGSIPRVGIFITPDNLNSGDLENLCVASLADDPFLSCANDYLDCIRKVQNIEHPHRSKALVQVYLAKEPNGDIHMGIASEKNIWNWGSPAFLPARNFLKML